MALPVAKSAWVGFSAADSFNKYGLSQSALEDGMTKLIGFDSNTRGISWAGIQYAATRFYLPLIVAHVVDKKLLGGSHKTIRKNTMGFFE